MRSIQSDVSRALAFFAAFTGGCNIEPATEEPDVSETAERIINGDVPAWGALANYGVVLVNGGCTGTLLTNQHVLTAHHCVRGYLPGGTWASSVSVPQNVVFEQSSGNQTGSISTTAGVLEAPEPWGLNALDYAVLRLDAPLSVDGEDDNFYNGIYANSDASLLDKQVLCIGYGATAEATATTFATGFGTLTSAPMVVDAVGNGSFRRDRTDNDQVGFGGDSGSSCFLNGLLVGVQSTCGANTWYDVNGDGVNGRWSEWADTTSCTSSAPSSHRTWVEQQVLANVSVEYVFVPPIAGLSTLNAIISTPRESNRVINIASPWSNNRYAPRSGWMQVTVSEANEPARTMCGRIHTHAPIAGDVAVRGVCLGDGVVAAILG